MEGNLNKTYTFYTHKGGVGKTTCLAHMAIKAIHEGKKVLVIDCDPQLNSTSFFFRYGGDLEFERYYEDVVQHHTILMKLPPTRTPAENEKLDAYRLQHTNIWDILREINPVDGIIQSFRRYPEIGVNIRTQGPGELRLLGSHPMLGEMETYLAREVNDNYHLRDYCLRFRALTNFLIGKYELDLVFVDLSPSSSFLNQNIILSSSYIILPCSADEYAYYSIRTFGMWLQSWTHRHALLGFTPKVLTVVYNKYKQHGGDGKTEVTVGDQVYKTSQPHAHYIRRLIGPEGAISALLRNNQQFTIPNIDYFDIPLICDGLSIVSHLSSISRTCYDANTKCYSTKKCAKLRIQYNRLWAKIAATLPNANNNNNHNHNNDDIDDDDDDDDMEQ